MQNKIMKNDLKNKINDSQIPEGHKTTLWFQDSPGRLPLWHN